MSFTPYPKDRTLGRQAIEISDYKKTAKNEAELQTVCEQWLRENKIYFVHVPDSAYQNKRSAHKLLGVPDLLVFIPEGKGHYNRSVLFELKSKTGKIRTGQERTARQVNVIVIRSFAAFVDEMQDFLRDCEKHICSYKL